MEACPGLCQRLEKIGRGNQSLFDAESLESLSGIAHWDADPKDAAVGIEDEDERAPPVEVGVDEEVGHFMFGKDPFFQAGLGELGDTVSSLSCLAAYQSGISSRPSDSFTLSVGAR